MKVLVVSHNVFSDTASMGKTLSAYFHGWNVEDIAQFYIHSEVPTSDICHKYFRITDKEALKSIFTRRCGRAFGKEDIQLGRSNPRTDTGMTMAVYEKCRKRTPGIYIARNLVWRLSGWHNRAFSEWLDDFSPDVVFFASGDYSFLYRVALRIAKERKIPLVMSCMDDYYFYNRNAENFLGPLQYHFFMHQVNKTMSYASSIMAICEKMSKDYAALFNIKCYTLHTPTEITEPFTAVKNGQISYLGSLGYKRYTQLVKIGQTLKKMQLPSGPEHIDVYSSEARKEVLDYLTPENGIHFHGQIPFEEVKEIMGHSLALIHTECFDAHIRNSVRYSVSTKIPDSLASGTCLFAFGPDDVASMEYLQDNDVAVVVNSDEQLQQGLENLILNEKNRTAIEHRAVSLAHKNHRSDINTQLVKQALMDAVSEKNGMSVNENK